MFSRQNQELDQIFTYYTTSRDSLKWYLDGIINNEVVDSLYIGYTKQELRDAFLGYIDELEKNIIFSILSSLEARFQIDYQNRVKKRYKDNLSKEFKKLSKNKKNVSLEHDILSLWKQEYPEYKEIVSDYIGALKYRHWLAHGRYWEAKTGGRNDLSEMTTIAYRIYENLSFYG